MKALDTYELSFDNVKVPKENLLGEKGGGFKIMMIELAKKRLKVALNAICGAEGVIEKTIEYKHADNNVGRIYAGTNEIMKVLIARGLFKELFQEMREQRKNNIKSTPISY